MNVRPDPPAAPANALQTFIDHQPPAPPDIEQFPSPAEPNDYAFCPGLVPLPTTIQGATQEYEARAVALQRFFPETESIDHPHHRLEATGWAYNDSIRTMGRRNGLSN